MKFKLASFFSGIGGIDLGFLQTGKVEIVYADELDKYPRSIYNANFALPADASDVCTVMPEAVPDFDILTAGFPCQPFSYAGKRQGFLDEKGNLFFELLRFIDYTKPALVFLENVPGLVCHDDGRMFAVIREELEKRGYTLRWDMLKTSEYGNLPQNRKRLYILGFKDARKAEKFKFPEKIPLTNTLTKLIDFNAIVPDKYYYAKDSLAYQELSAIMDDPESCYTYRLRKDPERPNALKFGNHIAPTLVARMCGGTNIPIIKTSTGTGIRRLTPRETLLLQGFPQDFIIPDDLSDASVYKACGNSVSVPVVRRLAEEALTALESERAS